MRSSQKKDQIYAKNDFCVRSIGGHDAQTAAVEPAAGAQVHAARHGARRVLQGGRSASAGGRSPDVAGVYGQDRGRRARCVRVGCCGTGAVGHAGRQALPDAPAGGHDAGNWDAWLISLSSGNEERPAATGRRQQFGRWAGHPKADADVGIPRTESDDDDEEASDTSDDGSDSFASAASSPNEAKPSKGGHGVGGDRGFKKPPSAASPPQRKRPAPVASKGQGQRKKLAQGKRAPMR